MKVISIINNKGGVGKTTLTANIGAQLAYEGYNVLLIDTDAQANLTLSLVEADVYRNQIEMTKTIRNLYATYFDDGKLIELESIIIKPNKTNLLVNDRLDLICSHPKLNEILEEFNFSRSKISKRNKKLVELEFLSILRSALKNLKNEYDFILIDCPPSLDKLTKNALVASDHYFVPVKLDYLSKDGLTNLLSTIDTLTKQYVHIASRDGFRKFDRINPTFNGVIANMVNIRSNEPISTQSKYLNEIQRNFGVLKQYLRFYPSPFYSAPETQVPLVIDNSIKEYPEVHDEIVRLVSEIKEKVN